MADPKIKYDIEAAVKGEQDVDALAGTLRELGDVLEGDLQQSAQAAARDLEALGNKQRVINEFTALKRESENLGSALTKAAAEVERLAPQLQEAGAKAQTMAAGEKTAAAALEQSKTALQSKRDALKALNTENAGAARKTVEFKDAQAGLKTAIAQATAEVKTRRTELQGAQQQSKLAAQAEKALGVEYEQTVKGAAKLSLELGNKNRALATSRETLQAVGVGTNNLAQAERNLQTAVSQVRERVLAMAPAYQQAAAASSASTQVQAGNQRTLREGITSISTQLQRVQQIATVALGGSYVGGLAKSVADTADEFTNLQARVKLATGDGEAFQQAWAGITRIALETNTALEETGTLFTRLEKTAREGGASAQQAQDQALALTRTINQAIQLSGGSAESAQAAVTQLIQGLQFGVLRGDEFNSVMEQAPRLAQAMAAGLGVTTGALRDMANKGQLTADVVMKALRDQASTVEAEFGKLPSTVGRALQNLQTQWTLYVGESNKGLVSSANAAKALNLLAENLDLVVSSLTAVGKVWAASRIASLASDFGAWVSKTLAATVALEANTAATTANAAAQTGLAAAQSRVAQAQTAATTATVANTAARSANANAWASIATFMGQATKATEAATVATVAGTTAATAKAGALGLLGTAARGVTGLLGGPVGLVATAVLFSGEIKRGIVAVTEWAAGFTDAGKKLKAFEQQEREAALAEKTAAEERKRQAEALRVQAAAAEEARNKMAGLTKEASASLAEFDKLVKGGKTVDEALNTIGKDFDLSSVPGIRNASAVLDRLASAGKITATQFEQAWAEALDGQDLAVFETKARAAMMSVRDEADKAAQALQDAMARGLEGKELEAFGAKARSALSAASYEAERFGQVVNAIAAESLKRAGTSVHELETGFSKALNTAINNTDKLAETLDKMGVTGERAGQLLAKSVDKEIEAANTEEALKALIDRLTEMGKNGQLSGEQVAAGLDKVKRKADEIKPGVNSVGEALRNFGLKSREELQLTADKFQQSWDVIRDSTTVALQDKIKAFAQYREAAIAANGGVESAEVVLQRRILETQAGVKGLGDEFEKQMQRAAGATDAAAEAQRRYNQVLRESVKYGPGVTDGSGIAGIKDDRLTGVREAGGQDNRLTANGGKDLSVLGNTGQGAYMLAEGLYAIDTTIRKGLDENGQMRYGLYNEGRGVPNSRPSPSPGGTVGGGAFGGYSTPATRAAASSRTVNVNLSLGGKTTSLTTSQSEADKLLRMIQDAQRASGR